MTAAVVVLAVVGWLLVAHTVVNALLLRRAPSGAQVRERVSILVPARNEADRIGPCVAALSGQLGLQDSELIVLDDQSSDGTADIVRATAADAKLLTGAPLPVGWQGKPHACTQLAATATGNVLVFVDADVVCAPDAVARAVTTLRDLDAALVSPYPKQCTGSWLEALVQPLLQWSWLAFLPLRVAERSRRPSLAVANGQFLVVDAAAYRGIGGHGAVRGEIVEDIALARAVKAAGGRATVTDGTALAQCRMYDGPRALVDGYAKWMWTAFGSPAGGVAVSVVMLALFVAPWLLVPWTPWAWLAAAPGPVSRVVSAARTGARPLPDALLHPLSVVAFVAIVGISIGRHRRRSLTWKGRSVG